MNSKKKFENIFINKGKNTKIKDPLIGDLTTGNVSKKIILFALPMLFGNLLQQLYNMADNIIVGRFVGKNAFAGVGSTGCLNFLIIGFILGMSCGLSIPVSQRFGAKDFSAMRKKIADAIYISIFLGIVITILTAFFAKDLLILLQTPAEIMDSAYTYIFIIFLGIPATILYNLPANILRSIGDSKTPLYFLLFSACVNVGLDLLFVLVFNMGVAGTATATVISQVLSGVLCIIYMRRKYPILFFQKGDREFNMQGIKQSFYMGVPMGLQFSITAIGSVIMQSAVNTLGADAVASINAAQKLQLLLMTPLDAIGVAIATYCGQNLGAGNYERIKEGVRKGLKIALAFAAIGMVLANLLAKPAVRLFILAEELTPEIIANVQLFMLINCCFYVLLTIIFIYRNAIQGLGGSMSAMLAGAAELIGRVIGAFLLARLFGFAGICFGNATAWLLADVVLIPLYFITLKRIRALLGVAEIDKKVKRIGLLKEGK